MNGICTLLGLICGVGCIVKIYDAATMGSEFLQNNMTWAGWLGGSAIFFFIIASATGSKEESSEDKHDRAVDEMLYPWEGMAAKDIINKWCDRSELGNEPWHKDKASKKQLATLKEHQVSWHRGITKGEASLVITFIFDFEPFEDDDD